MSKKNNTTKNIYFSAKFTDKTSPSIVAKEYYKYLEPYSYACKQNSKFIRLIHFLVNLRKVDIVLVLGRSRFNYWATKVSKLFGKRIIFLMHSYRKIENMYDYDKHQLVKYEAKMLNSADKIICVSKFLSETLKNELPAYEKKIFWVNNGIKKYECKKRKNDEYTIMSIGGGLRIKNNLAVCRAIEQIKNKKIKFGVIGDYGIDSDEIRRYPFVEYYEYLPHDVILRKMEETDLYIQNSFYESFGLSVCEAISLGCKVLVSKNVGMIDVMKIYDKNIVIQDNQCIDEIKEKIIWIMNNEAICELDYDENSWEKASERLMKMANES